MDYSDRRRLPKDAGINHKGEEFLPLDLINELSKSRLYQASQGVGTGEGISLDQF